ncbi:MAG: 1,6-anhydro-N-acetylmuramyl-L-alanine amidase AmpD [Methylococcaceae bacterium]|nr:1,6-anhydro-N-acetylmuramyl-L-alanine amidase AmpD [Methylococcaceae bacterium]
MQIKNHRLTDISQISSPNCNPRFDETDISLIVIHNISLPPQQFGGDYITQLFCNCLNPNEHPYFKEIYQLKVSAHLLIRRNGDVIQYVPFHQRAWHAGKSLYQGRERCNDFSIGIELEGADNIPYTQAQYLKLAAVIQLLIQHYPQLNKERITGHSDVAPERKTDPSVSFLWSKLFQLLETGVETSI